MFQPSSFSSDCKSRDQIYKWSIYLLAPITVSFAPGILWQAISAFCSMKRWSKKASITVSRSQSVLSPEDKTKRWYLQIGYGKSQDSIFLDSCCNTTWIKRPWWYPNIYRSPAKVPKHQSRKVSSTVNNNSKSYDWWPFTHWLSSIYSLPIFKPHAAPSFLSIYLRQAEVRRLQFSIPDPFILYRHLCQNHLK